jgi:hypothetical protein
MEKEALVNI